MFNDRDVDGLLAMMTDDVEWPDVARSDVLRDKASIRAYWDGQFAVARPQVTPSGFVDVGDDVVAVVTQVVLDLAGEPLAPPSTVFHRYTFDRSGLVRRMVVFTDLEQATSP